MSDHKPKTKTESPPRSFGWMAQYADENQLLSAARKVRDSGYTRTDAFTPFPVHGIDEALGIKPTILPFIVLAAGLTGLTTALVMQIWMNAIDYPYIISGKPYQSWPAFIPVAFELTILFSAFTSFLGMIALNRLPRFSNPVFTNPKFDRVTDDRFFLYVDSGDKYYNSHSVKELLSGTHAESVDEVLEDSTPSAMPKAVGMTLLALFLLALIPVTVVLKMRNGNSSSPRLHVFFDMDFQPKKKSHQTTTIFADQRVMRPQVSGTLARGQLDEQDPYYLGYDPSKLALKISEGSKLVSMNQQDANAGSPVQATDGKATDAATAAAAPSPGPNLPWINDIPADKDASTMALGKLKFESYCAACHGLGGDGDGLVAKRADQLAQGYWLPPTSMHDPRVRAQPSGQIFYTISNGKGKMAAYGSSITPKERWAIVLYVRALQRSRNANPEDVPESEKAKLTSE